jgi:hypothetical protein
MGRLANKLARALFIALGIWVTWSLIVVLADIGSEMGLQHRMQQAQQNLPRARQQWANAGISNYQIKVGISNLWALREFMDPERIYLCGMNSDTLTVKDGRVVGARELVECGKIYNQLTVGEVFAVAERYQASRSPAIETLQFDPGYGYITRLILKYPSSGHPIILEYSDLVILDQQTTKLISI